MRRVESEQRVDVGFRQLGRKDQAMGREVCVCLASHALCVTVLLHCVTAHAVCVTAYAVCVTAFLH